MTINSKQSNSSKTVVVGLTGRTDSAVAAYLLKKQGFKVIGVSLVTINKELVDQPNYLPKCHIPDLESVNNFCEKINIPFYASDAKPQFETEVLDTLISNKLTARANTSCFNCTKMRIHVLYEKMKQLKADFIATGHFCKVYKNYSSDEFFIHSNNDPKSDQSYLLAGLEKKYLQHLLLPLGELRKEEVKKIARNFALGVVESKYQEGFCFREKQATSKILDRAIPKSLIIEGKIINIEEDVVVGEHNGIIYHYITESDFPVKGTTLLEKGLEVVNYRFDNGAISVAGKDHLTYIGTQVIKLKLSGALDKKRPIGCFIKFKYENKFTKAVLYFKNNDTAYLEFETDVYPLIEGELVALYDSSSRNSKIIGLGEIGIPGEFKLIDRVDEYRTKIDEEEKEDEKDNYFKF